MLFDVNNTISIKRLVDTAWKTAYSSTIATDIKVYIYRPSDEYTEMWDVEWWAISNKMVTNYNDIQVWDKIIDENSIEYIVREVTQRKSFIATFKEVTLMKQYD